MSTIEERLASTQESRRRRIMRVGQVHRLKDQGYSNKEISEQLKIPESTVRIYALEEVEES